MLSVFCSPSRYTQGKNATASLGSKMTGLGPREPALVLAGRSALRLLANTWNRTLSEAGMAHAVHPFGGECSLAEIKRVKRAAQQHRARVIVGAGGGKVLDTARAAAVGTGGTDKAHLTRRIIAANPAWLAYCSTQLRLTRCGRPAFV
jgi:glycerol dehydrogenase